MIICNEFQQCPDFNKPIKSGDIDVKTSLLLPITRPVLKRVLTLLLLTLSLLLFLFISSITTFSRIRFIRLVMDTAESATA